MDELDAQIAVLEAEKARRQRQFANAVSVGSGSAAAAAMTAAGAQLPQTQEGKRAKRAAGPTSEVSRKSPRGARD
jgi:mevalonate pyrophosphate decarboxylase